MQSNNRTLLLCPGKFVIAWITRNKIYGNLSNYNINNQLTCHAEIAIAGIGVCDVLRAEHAAACVSPQWHE